MSQLPNNEAGVRENDFPLKTDLVDTDRIRIATANENYNMTVGQFKDLIGYTALQQRTQDLEDEFNTHEADTVTDNVHGLQDRFKDAQIITSNLDGAWGVAIDMDLEDGFYWLLFNRDNAIYYIGVWKSEGTISEILPLGGATLSMTGKRLLVDVASRTRGYVLLKLS